MFGLYRIIQGGFFRSFSIGLKSITLTILIIFSLSLGSVLAQKGLEITPFLGYQFGGNRTVSDGKINIEDSENFGLIVDIPIPEPIGLQAEISYSRQNTSLEKRSNSSSTAEKLFDMSADYFLAGALYQEDLGRFIPFVIISVGASYFKPKDSNYASEWLFAGSIGFGCKTFISDNVGLRFQGRLMVPIVFKDSSLWCRSGSGCVIQAKGGAVLYQGDISAGIIFAL